MTSLESLSENLSTRLAGMQTRRSFLGKLGVTTLVAVTGVTASDLLGNSVAYAGLCACDCNHSVDCCAYGSCGSSCPSGSCFCGYWNVCGGCSGQYKRFKDCCAACTGGCQCKNGEPTCCFTRPHSNGSDTCNYTRVKCRAIYCVTVNC